MLVNHDVTKHVVRSINATVDETDLRAGASAHAIAPAAVAELTPCVTHREPYITSRTSQPHLRLHACDPARAPHPAAPPPSTSPLSVYK